LKTHHRRTDYDSRVILSDFHIARPAVSMHDLGIDQIQLVKRRREAEKFKIEPFQMREMQKRGTVLTPSQSVDEFSNIALRVYTQQGARQVELLDKDISIIYYPVWRIHYQYRKTSFQVLLDGITGERVYSRYPVNEERRLLAFLIGTGSLGLIAGSFIQLMMRLSWAEEYAQKLFVMGIYFWMFFAFIISAIAAFAWDQLRYPSEVVYRGSMREAVKIGKKSKSFFEKTVEKILKHIDLSIQSDSR